LVGLSGGQSCGQLFRCINVRELFVKEGDSGLQIELQVEMKWTL